MKNLKKLLAVIVSMTMVLSACTVLASAKSYPDVASDNAAYEAVSILSGLGIVQGDDEGNYNPDATLKRSEAAAILCRVVGAGNVAAPSASIFTDVAVDHWAAGYINTAAGMGYINGRGDGTFDPDATLKYQEFVKMLVEAMGYGPMAKNRGGYPVGHLVAASSAGVTDGINVAGGEAEATRAVVARLAYNAIDGPLMEQDGWGIYNESYTVYNGKNGNEKRTLASENLGVVKAKATVTANNRTSLTSGGAITRKRGVDPQVKMTLNDLYDVEYNDYEEDDVVTAYVGDTTASDYLGYDVIVYLVQDDNDEDVIAAIVPERNKSQELVVTSDIDEGETGFVTEGTSKGLNFAYWEDKDNDRDSTEVEVTSDATVIFNGTYVGKANALNANFDEEVIKTADEVKFVGPSNGDYDKVFITCYQYGLVEEVDVENLTIDAGDLFIDLDNSSSTIDFDYTVTYDGNRIGLEDIQENDVVNVVFENDDETDYDFVDIIISRDTIEGKLTSKSPKADGNGTVYEYAFNNEDTYYDAISSKGDDFALNDEGTFYLSITGKIVDFVQGVDDELSDNYAFITKMAPSVGSFDDTYEIRLFTIDGNVVKYEMSNRLKVRDYSGDILEGIVDGYKEGNTATLRSDGSNSPLKQFVEKYYKADATDTILQDTADLHIAERLVQYKTNSAGQLDTLVIAGEDAVGNNSKYNYTTDSRASYDADLNTLGAYDIKDGSKLFYIPAAEEADSKGYNVDEDDLEIRSLANIDEDEKAKAWFFNINTNNQFDVAVMTEDIAMSAQNALAVVDKKSRGTNDNDEEVTTLTLLQGGSTKTLYCTSDTVDVKKVGGGSANITEDGLAKGDIIQYTLNGNGEISKILWIYEAAAYDLKTNDGTAQKIGSASLDKDVQYAFGIVTDTARNRITLSNTIGSTSRTTDTEVANTGKKVAYNSDAENGTVVTNTKSVRIDGGTVANFDQAKSSNYLKTLSSAASLTKTVRNNKVYVAVVRIENNAVTDVVQVTVPTNNTVWSTGDNFVIFPRDPEEPVNAGNTQTESVVEPTQAPATEAPATEAPATEAPATETPAADATETEAPVVTDVPATE